MIQNDFDLRLLMRERERERDQLMEEARVAAALEPSPNVDRWRDRAAFPTRIAPPQGATGRAAARARPIAPRVVAEAT